MSEVLSFPGLGLEFHLNPVAFALGPLTIRWYGVIFACAALLAMLYIFRRVKEFGLDADRMVDVLLGCILGGFICARAYYVVFSWDTYKDNLPAVFRIWEGGIAMYGGVIGAAVCAVFLCRWRRVKLLPAVDLGLSGLLLAQSIGRWGNFVNMEAFGSNTTAPWGMTGPAITRYLQSQKAALANLGVIVDPQMPVHPTFLYESLWCLLGFVLLALYTKRRRFDGELALIYLGWYGLGRFFIEGLRTDSLLFGAVRVSQILALLCVIASVLVWATVRSRIRREGDPDYLKLYVDTEEGQAVVAGTFYLKAAGKEDAPEAEAGAEEPSEAAAGAGEADESRDTDETPAEKPLEAIEDKARERVEEAASGPPEAAENGGEAE